MQNSRSILDRDVFVGFAMKWSHTSPSISWAKQK